MRLEVLDGDAYSLETTGKDPYHFTEPLLEDLDSKNNRLAFEYFCPTGVNFSEIHFYPEREGLKLKIERHMGSTDVWVEFNINLSEELKQWGKIVPP